MMPENTAEYTLDESCTQENDTLMSIKEDFSCITCGSIYDKKKEKKDELCCNGQPDVTDKYKNQML